MEQIIRLSRQVIPLAMLGLFTFSLPAPAQETGWVGYRHLESRRTGAHFPIRIR
ncbi:hypothetical protein [Lysobacter sp. F60174L2]|uniref:hypothetical protein n=1 Tax=Lysobacter sp. F60174L2 TaxID=3459295 RepID=UPI00403DB25C